MILTHAVQLFPPQVTLPRFSAVCVRPLAWSRCSLCRDVTLLPYHVPGFLFITLAEAQARQQILICTISSREFNLAFGFKS